MKKTACIFILNYLIFFVITNVSFADEKDNKRYESGSIKKWGAWEKEIKEDRPSSEIAGELLLKSLVSENKHLKLIEYLNNIKPSHGTPSQTLNPGDIPKPLPPVPPSVTPPSLPLAPLGSTGF